MQLHTHICTYVHTHMTMFCRAPLVEARMPARAPSPQKTKTQARAATASWSAPGPRPLFGSDWRKPTPPNTTSAMTVSPAALVASFARAAGRRRGGTRQARYTKRPSIPSAAKGMHEAYALGAAAAPTHPRGGVELDAKPGIRPHGGKPWALLSESPAGRPEQEEPKPERALAKATDPRGRHASPAPEQEDQEEQDKEDEEGS